MKCTNCQNETAPESNYCSACGQSLTNLDQPIMTVMSQVFHELFDTDGRLFATFKTLWQHPGQISLDFEHGKRARYAPPLRFYLVVSLLFFLVLSGVEYMFTDRADRAPAVIEVYAKFMFFMLPAFAGFMQLVYRKKRFLFNLVFSLHLHSYSFIVLIFMLPLERLADEYLLIAVIQLGIFVYLWRYLYLAFKGFYQEIWYKTLIKMLVVCLLYLLLTTGVITFISRFMV